MELEGETKVTNADVEGEVALDVIEEAIEHVNFNEVQTEVVESLTHA